MRFTVVILSALLCSSAFAEATVEKDSDEALVAAAEKLVNEGAPKSSASEATGPSSAQENPPAAVQKAETATASPTDQEAAALPTEPKKESEIPLFNKSEKLVKSESSLMWRLVGSIAFVALLGGILIYAGRRWTRVKNKGGEKARIEILHQFHMGPKRSLALVRVAGEAILIGCTDQNINMLKAVTLIDEELEGVLGKDFNTFLEDDFSIEDVRKALIPRA